ncbi:SH3 domain-containing protein [Edwardsiella tarda]|nr:SH3 domain-containing protein [Edwardsiella tarda]
MHKFCRLLLPLLGLCLAFQSHADEQRFISDALSTYVHSGPGNQYRIVGTINAGDPVTLLGVNQQTQFAQIRDARGAMSGFPSINSAISLAYAPACPS